MSNNFFWVTFSQHIHTVVSRIYVYIYIYLVIMYNIYTIYKYKYNIYGNHKAVISHHGCSYYQVITRQKEQNIFCIRHSPSSDASFQQITIHEYTILQFFFHNNSVTLQYKQSTKRLLYNFNFLNDYTKEERKFFLSKN